MLPKASSFAGTVDNIFLSIIGLSVVLLAAITFLMVYFVIKYHRSKNVRPTNIEGNVALEVTWTVIPTLIVMVMFYYGWVGFDTIRSVPKEASVVKVTASQWSWLFEYDNGKQSDVLRVAVGKPVKLELSSRDVLHSLFIPAFRVKEDVVPGMGTYLWFKPTEVGSYDLSCTEYCGLRHSYMLTKVEVMPEADFKQWYSVDGAVAKAVGGEELFKVKGCIACHTTDGSPLVGPTLKGIFGRKTTVVTAGEEREVTVDEQYVRKSMFEPAADLVKGFPPIMPSQRDLSTKEEIEAIIAYLKGLQ